MDLKVPSAISYLLLNYHNKCGNISATIDENNDNSIYISFLCNRNHILKTLIVEPNSMISARYGEWKSSHRYNLSPRTFAYIDAKKLIITNGEKIVDENKASNIVKYVFNPHERVGAIILIDSSVFRRKKYAIIGFNDDSYNVFNSPLIDIVPYANGFIIAYKDGEQIVLEKIPKGIERRYYIKTKTLALHSHNDLISVTHDHGSLIIDGKSMEVLSNVSLRNGIPLGIANDMILLWNPKSYAVYMKNYIDDKSKEKIALMCKNLPILAGTLEDKILLGCSNNIIEIEDNNWRLHEISKKILGKELVSTLIIGESLIIGTLDEVIVWGVERYYFRVMNLLGITKFFNKHLVVVDEEHVGVVDVNKCIEGNNVISYSKSHFDENLRFKKKINFNENIIIQRISSHGNRIIKKRKNSFNIIFIKDNPVIFDIAYYGKYKVMKNDIIISDDFKILSAEIVSYKTSSPTEILKVEYVYMNPLDKDVLKSIKMNEKNIGYIKLRKRSKGRALVQIPVNNIDNRGHIVIGDLVIPINRRIVKERRYSINNISIDLTNEKITLLINVLTDNLVNRNERAYVCVRGFFNGCKNLGITGNIITNINIPVTINYHKDYINVSLYGLLESPYKVEPIAYDEKNITVNSNVISLIMMTHKGKLYMIIDDLPTIDKDIIILINNLMKKYKVKKLPFLLSYKMNNSSRQKARAIILQLNKGILYYNRIGY